MKTPFTKFVPWTWHAFWKVQDFIYFFVLNQNSYQRHLKWQVEMRCKWVLFGRKCIETSRRNRDRDVEAENTVVSYEFFFFMALMFQVKGLIFQVKGTKVYTWILQLHVRLQKYIGKCECWENKRQIKKTSKLLKEFFKALSGMWFVICTGCCWF